ncbi:MAG: dockerin type I repeat-containing protein [Clostridia bacterium]|nr:dockerin type I repeat-containing protein [Clostridia bacterium]
MNLKKSISLVLTLCMVFSLFATFVFPVAAEEGSATISFANTANRTAFSTSEQVWEQNGITVTNTKTATSSDVADYVAPVRFYKNSIVKIDYAGMTKIEIDCAGIADKNINAWVNSCNDANATATREDSVVTIVFAEAVDSFTITLTDNQARANAMTVYYAIEEEAPVTSQVVDNWNHADWNTGVNAENGAYIYTDATVYAETSMEWWNHAAFAPTETEGMYEVTEVALNGSAAAKESSLTIPEGGFVWVGWSGAAADSAGKYAFDFISRLVDGDKVTFYGLDIANCTTTADAYAEKFIPPVVAENVALNKGYTYPTENLYYHWSDEWTCTDNVATALTDGVRVAGYYGKGETSGWGGATPRFVDIVIDLEAVYDISGFAYVLTGGADGILHPETVEILVSDDNVTFTPVSVRTVSGNAYVGESWSPCYDLDYYATPAAAVAGRYVKFVFHKVEGTNFVFINELEVWGTEAVVEEDDDSFKDTYTYVDGVTNGTAQSRADGWESIPVVDFWYLVEDGESTVTIKVAVDNKKALADDTMFRIWIDADPSDTARTTLYDFKVDADGKGYDGMHSSSIAGGYTSFEYYVIGNDYYFTVVLDKATLGITGQYGLNLQLGQAGYNTLHSITWDAFDNSLVPWSTTAFYEIFGEEPEVEYNEVVVDVNTNAVLTDGLTGFNGGWGAVGTGKVALIQNDKCTTNPMKVVVNYALGETKTIDALVLDFYHCAAVMIGYPEGKVLVEYSVDGVEYVALGEYDLEAATLSTAADGTVSSTLAFDAVDAAYVRATFVVGASTGVLGDSPADGKVFWEFASLAEVAVNEVPAAPEYNTGWNVEYDDTQIKISSGNDAFVAALTDNVWAEGATSFGTTGVLLVQNLVCKNPELYPELTLVYNAGTAIDVNNIKVGLYVETNSMIGYPSKDAKVYVSTDGIEWTPVESTTDIPESVFVQHGNAENSLGTYVANIEFATSTAQYVKVVFTYTDSPFNDPEADYKPVYEFIAFTEAEVSYVEPSAELPEDATGLDVYGYTHTFLNYVMYVDTDMTLGELTAKYYGSSKDLNYFKVIVVNADGTVAATYLELDRNTNPASVKTNIAVTAGQYVLALSANEANVGRHEIADTVNVGDIVTLYNVDLTAAPGALTNAGFTVKAAAPALDEVDGGDLPAFNPMLGQNVVIPANTALSYNVAFEDGAFFALYDENVTVLVNGEAIDGEANLVKGDVVTLINASAEEYVAYPRCVPVIKGTMSNPFIIDVLGDITANVTDAIAMDGGAAFYTYTATADGKIVFTMLTETNWTYTVNNLTAGIYGDTQWSDSDPVLKTWTVEVKEGDEVQISVAPYNPDDPWATPAGEIKFNVAFEAAKTYVTGEFSEGGELNQTNVFAANAHNIWNKDFSNNSWWGVTVLEWNAEENAWEVVKVLLSGADAKDGTLTETQIALAAHVDNAAAYASITALQVGDIVYIWDAGVATTDKLVDGVDANGGFYTTDPEKTGTTALTYKKVEYLEGDANMNGKIDANDYATIRKLVVGALSEEDVDAKTLELADVNGNGKIDANDYILVKRHVLGTYTIPAWEDVE